MTHHITYHSQQKHFSQTLKKQTSEKYCSEKFFIPNINTTFTTSKSEFEQFNKEKILKQKQQTRSNSFIKVVVFNNHLFLT